MNNTIVLVIAQHAIDTWCNSDCKKKVHKECAGYLKCATNTVNSIWFSAKASASILFFRYLALVLLWNISTS
jgi:hypothetical protein